MSATGQVITLHLPNGQPLSLPWKYSTRSRSIRLTAGHGEIRVSSPRYTPRHTVESFLLQQLPWIQHQLSKFEHLEKNIFYFHGQPHQVVLRDSTFSNHRVYKEENTIVIHPITHSVDSITATLERWLQSEASALCAPLIREIAIGMGVEVPTLRFKETRSRWGSCSSSGSITLNWRLVHTPAEVARYVIIHELAHRVHMNHSKDFWQLVEKHDPDFRIHRGWLKRQGHLCRTPIVTI